MANKKIYELEELTTPVSDDLLLINQSSTSKDKKVKMSNLVSNDTIEGAVDAWLDDHPEATTTVEDGSITPAKLHQDTLDMFDEKADIDGYYEDMSVGSAEQLLSNMFEDDSTPYLYRTSGGSLEIGNRVYEDAIVGGSVAWNQMLNADDFSSASWIAQNGAIKNSVSADNVLDISFSTDSASQIVRSISLTNGHVFLTTVDVKLPNTEGQLSLLGGASSWKAKTTATTNWQTVATIFNSQPYPFWILRNESGVEINNALVKNARVHDLTSMFGSTIANYIYSLEQATAGSGIAWLKSQGFFTKDYYAYNAGGIKSVKTSAKKVVGFNQFDANTSSEWMNVYISDDTVTNYTYGKSAVIRCLPNTTYYAKHSKGSRLRVGSFPEYPEIGMVSTNVTSYSSESGGCVSYTTGANDKYLLIWFYNSIVDTGLTAQDVADTLVVNLHWDGERDGEYEAYEEHTYPLDSNLELRGIPKLVDGKIKYDGDLYESDGSVTRRYGIVDLGTLNWGLGGSGNRDFWASYSDFPIISTTTKVPNIVSTMYKADSFANVFNNPTDKTCGFHNLYHRIYVANFDYTDVETFKTAMSGQYLVFELAIPTTESADPYTNPQLVDNWGTEEFVDTREVPVPVGHESRYLPDLKAKVESAPNNPSTNGKYFLQYQNGEATYVTVPSEVPEAPSEDGTYVLKATVSSGVATLSWVTES